jgi:hypothetical protein
MMLNFKLPPLYNGIIYDTNQYRAKSWTKNVLFYKALQDIEIFLHPIMYLF